MNTITLSGSDLANLRRVSLARSFDITKPTLSGVLIEPRGLNDLMAVATDGFTLAFVPIHIERHGVTEKVLIPAAMAAEIGRRKLTQTSYLVIGEDGLHFFHKAGGIGAIVSHQAKGWNFPAWYKVLPDPKDLRPARPEELVFGRATCEKATNALNGGKVDYPKEIREGALTSEAGGAVFNSLNGVVVATMPIKFAQFQGVSDSSEIRSGIENALRGVAA